MTTQAIFLLQFMSSLLVIGLLARWVLAPWLANQSQRNALFWLTLPHAFRYVGMVFLVPGVVAQPLPDNFAVAAAYGDLLAAVLALLALVALRTGRVGAVGAVWIFNVVGTVDLLNALRHVEVAPLFGAAWYIPTMLVPLLLVTHIMIFTRLLEHASGRYRRNRRKIENQRPVSDFRPWSNRKVEGE